MPNRYVCVRYRHDGCWSEDALPEVGVVASRRLVLRTSQCQAQPRHRGRCLRCHLFVDLLRLRCARAAPRPAKELHPVADLVQARCGGRSEAPEVKASRRIAGSEVRRGHTGLDTSTASSKASGHSDSRLPLQALLRLRSVCTCLFLLRIRAQCATFSAR
eukprot:6184481-Pleurochrysis_carterae.AAC.2